VYGNLDAPLSPEGEAEARRAANALAEVPLACVASSGLGRAEFGAAILRADRGLERRDERDLAEIHRGEWQGLDPSEIELRWPGGWRGWWLRPQAERPPGGESLTDLSRRVLPCLERLADEFPGEQIAVVAHSWVIRVSATHALGLPIGAATRLELPPASLAVLDWPARSAGRSRRPVLAGFCVDRPPERRDGWFRGPRR
jgi:broad specificity phosphatase PhoE